MSGPAAAQRIRRAAEEIEPDPDQELVQRYLFGKHDNDAEEEEP